MLVIFAEKFILSKTKFFTAEMLHNCMNINHVCSKEFFERLWKLRGIM